MNRAIIISLFLGFCGVCPCVQSDEVPPPTQTGMTMVVESTLITNENGSKVRTVVTYQFRLTSDGKRFLCQALLDGKEVPGQFEGSIADFEALCRLAREEIFKMTRGTPPELVYRGPMVVPSTWTREFTLKLAGESVSLAGTIVSSVEEFAGRAESSAFIVKLFESVFYNTNFPFEMGLGLGEIYSTESVYLEYESPQGEKVPFVPWYSTQGRVHWAKVQALRDDVRPHGNTSAPAIQAE